MHSGTLVSVSCEGNFAYLRFGCEGKGGGAGEEFEGGGVNKEKGRTALLCLKVLRVDVG